MIDRIQAKMLATGRTGCYYLCAADVAECFLGRAVDPIEAFSFLVNKGAMNDECYMRYPDKVMELFTGLKWKVIKAGPGHPLPLNYQCRGLEWEVLRYERPKLKDMSDDDCVHFIRGDGTGLPLPGGDPMGASQVVAQGKLVSKRIFRQVIG